MSETVPHIERHRTITAPRTVVWDVVTDHELYGDVAPNLASVEVLEGAGADLVRRCTDTDGNVWTEACTRWEPGTAFAVAVDVSESDFHRRLFHRFTGEWRLADRPDGVRVTIRFAFTPRYGPLGLLITKYLESRGPPIIETILDRWEREVSDRTASTSKGEPNAVYR